MKLSIVVPVFNEEKTIVSVLDRLADLSLGDVEKEIVVIDDGSKDASGKIVKKFIESSKNNHFYFYQHSNNQGKGAAVRTGIQKATGDYIVIQDADLEYNPKDILRLLKAVKNGSRVVYGTRLKRLPNFSKEERTGRFLAHYLGNKFLSLVTSILYGQWLTDMETCYKLFPRKDVLQMKLQARGFEFEPEITARLIKKGFAIHEIPITATPRGYAEGKKLDTFRDGKKALWTLLKYRFID